MNEPPARAVSDVVAFTLTFSTVVLMVGIVYVGGAVQLQSITDARTVDNTERGLELLSRNVRDHRAEGAPSRTTSIDLAGGTLRVGEPVTFNVTVVGANEWYTVDTRPVVYRAEHGAQVVYLNGAVLRATGDGSSLVVDEPPFVVGDRTVIPFVRTRADGAQSVGGDTTVQVQTRLSNRRVFGAYRGTKEYTVRLNVTSPRASAWKRYLSETRATCSLTGSTVTCTWETESVRLSLATVDVALY